MPGLLTIVTILVFILEEANGGDKLFFNDTSFMQVTTATIPLKQGFDLSFRTCHGGVLLYQAGNGDDFVLLRVSPGTVDYNRSVSPPYITPSHLTLQWKVGGVEGSVHAGNELDKNYIYTVTFDPGSSAVNATIKIDGPNRYSAVVPKDILNFIKSGPMYAGGNLSNTSSIKGFVGCIESGRNIPLVLSQGATNVQAGCPLDSQAGCTRKKCDPGFTGYYCEVNINECSGNPCHSFSACVDGVDSYTCTCGPQWSGKNCDTFLGSLCDAKPCKNGGVCSESFDKNNYTCTCPAGWTGRNCDSAFNPCALSPCLNNGTCYRDGNNSNGYNCTCQTGFTGVKCETDINDCASFPCANGKCVDGINNYTCNCTGSGYTGPTCSENVNECDSSPCMNNATCHDYIGTYACRCVRGFEGKHCQNNIDDCSPNRCDNGGNCTDKIDGFGCTCPAGFSGTRCENNIDDCVNNNCNPNQQCIYQINGYLCVCKPGFTGSNCSVDIVECLSNPCKNNGTCNEGVNGYNCSCLPRFNGTHCELDTIDDCASQPCLNNGTCVDGVADFNCNCTKGFHGKRCELDACYPNPCENNGTCSAVNNYDFNCTCRLGFMGRNCSINIDDCQSNTCVQNATCIDGINTYTCQCPSGYHGDFCQIEIDECASNPCKNNATCSNEIGHYKCHCPSGFNGTQCEINIDDCPLHGCNNGTCVDGINNYTCTCDKGFGRDHCDRDIDECLNNAACMNGGTCHNTIGSYYCVCNEFTNGTHCELDIDECQNKTICNTAVCRNREYTGYKCYCDQGWTGDNCYENINECGHKGNPCKNGATCVDGLNKYTCLCTSGWEGKDCDQDIDECALGYCKNGSTCSNGDGTYNCTCVPGYTDKNCSTDIDECASNPCYNGATCNDHVNYFNCTCVPGYTGYNCSIDMDECASYPCQNNATCSDLINQFNCSCPANYTGRLCEYSISRCRPNNPCLNNGTCLDQGLDNYMCSCSPGFGGKNCENSTTISMNGSSYMAFNVGKSILTVSLQFRTTLKYGVLAVDSGGNFSMKLKEEGLLLNYAGESRTVESNANLTDGHWHEVLVNLTSTSIQINVDNSSCSDCTKTMSRSSNDVLAKLSIGGSSNIGNKKPLIGCIRAVEVDGLTVIPTHSDVELVSVTSGCPRVPVCQPNPCANGRCIDEWLEYRCECNRPWTGGQCNIAFIAGTFGAQSTLNNAARRRRSLVQSNANASYAKFSTPTTFTILSELSFFIRTRESSGLIAFFTGTSGHITVVLSNGAIFIQSTVGGTKNPLTLNPKVNDGRYHYISINVNKSKVDNVTGPGMTLPSPIHLSSTYLGGLKDWSEFSEDVVKITKGFRGCIQDMRLNNKLFLFFKDPTSLDSYQLVENQGLDKGCPGENICAASPCGGKGRCEDTWNDFKCHCNRFYGGKHCSLYGCSLVQPCDGGSKCMDVDNGKFECVSPATFNTSLSQASFTLTSYVNLKPQFSFMIRTRQSHGTIFTASKNNQKLIVRIDNGTLNVTYALGGASGNMLSAKLINDGRWHKVMVNLSNSAQLEIDGTVESFSEPPFTGQALQNLLNMTSLHIGSATQMPFKGCLDNLRVGGALLPFKNYYNSSYNVSHVTPLKPHFDSQLTGVSLSCHSDDVCSLQPCIRGNCSDVWDAFKCSCPEGYAGLKCNNTANMTCAHQPCVNHATCSNNVTAHLESSFQISDFGKDRFICHCPAGYHGRQCEKVTDECSSSPCQNGGNCADLHLSYTCTCVAGFTGRNCEINIDDCIGNNCTNNATCADGVNTYTCSCTEGFNGKFCQHDIDECDIKVCYEPGTYNCTNTIGSYECRCKEEFYGRHCAYNATEWCKVGKPCHHGNCSGNSTGFYCSCAAGWEGLTCADDIHACANLNSPCKHNGTCIDSHTSNQVFPGYRCKCTVDYTGKDCGKLVDPCDASPWPCIHGTCSRISYNKYHCNCTEGFNGTFCQHDIDECDLKVCYEPGTYNCTNTIGSYECRCKEGFYGRNCAYNATEWCKVGKPCHHGNCSGNSTGFYCSCAAGWEGVTCADDIRECANSPCKHDGICMDSHTLNQQVFPGYFCKCAKPYTGVNCEEFYQVTNDEDSAMYVHFAWMLPFVIIIIILLVIVLKQRREIAFTRKSSKLSELYNESEPSVFPSFDSEFEQEQVPRNEQIPLDSMTSPSTLANDDYEPVDQIIIDQQRHLPTLPHGNTNNDDNNHRAYISMEHVSSIETAEQNYGSSGQSYYNEAHDPEYDTQLYHSSRDRSDLSANHDVLQVPNHYQQLDSSVQRSNQRVYQTLRHDTREDDGDTREDDGDTREDDGAKGPGNYASLGASAVQEYQRLNRSVRFNNNELSDCNA